VFRHCRLRVIIRRLQFSSGELWSKNTGRFAVRFIQCAGSYPQARCLGNTGFNSRRFFSSQNELDYLPVRGGRDPLPLFPEAVRYVKFDYLCHNPSVLLANAPFQVCPGPPILQNNLVLKSLVGCLQISGSYSPANHPKGFPREQSTDDLPERTFTLRHILLRQGARTAAFDPTVFTSRVTF
jgi:hypothetical protein